ncbi:SCO2523 family variant P-loop protein [Phytohabitans kaempferiae]|uniref:SCO2523 family variant P-loop protein n=1 Tax=Phytohabitans kaempferiae TaxID=1620943 RepID=A0ABV6M8F3_9ACTN
MTSSNVVYRRSLQGSDVCYLDFDFGSPTAGTIFNVDAAARGIRSGNGLHSYMQGRVSDPVALDIWTESDRPSLRHRPPGAGRLVLYPGDAGGSEFFIDDDVIKRCIRLLRRLDEEFDLCLLDLSAGRSYATEMVLAATAAPEMRSVTARWLVFHRWTRQHIIAANGLVFGQRGIIEVGRDRGHDPQALGDAIRFVRTAVVDPNSEELAGLRSSQIAWLRDCNRDLQELASSRKVGRTTMLGAIPLDPVLQWREQLISDNDVYARQIANRETIDAFETLAKRLTEEAAWVTL